MSAAVAVVSRARATPVARRRWLIVAALLVVAAVCAAALAAVHRADRSAHTSAVAETLTYERALTPAARQGGVVIQLGMKPAVSRLAGDEPDAATFQAIGWVDQLEAVRQTFRTTPTPRSLRGNSTDFDIALRLYEDAARHLGAAAIGTGQSRRTLLDQAVAEARRADTSFNRASARLQARRRALGLGPTSAFPDPAGR